MKTRNRLTWLLFSFVALAISLGAFFGGEKQAEAVSGDWGIIRQGYYYDECIYYVFVRNELDVNINGVGVRVAFRDSSAKGLGTYNLVGDTFVAPWTTEIVGWRIPEICSYVEQASILKSVAAY
jgi:hypothetical protein